MKVETTFVNGVNPFIEPPGKGRYGPTALAFLSQQPRSPVMALAAHLNVRKNSAQRVLKRLVEDGLVIRQKIPTTNLYVYSLLHREPRFERVH